MDRSPPPPPDRMRLADLLDPAAAPFLVGRLQVDHAWLPVHEHDFFEAGVVLGGSGIHVSVHGERPFERGDAVLLRPGAWHAIREARDLDVAVCGFPADLLHAELGWATEDPLLSALLVRGPLARGRRGLLHLRLDDDALEACAHHLFHLDALQRRARPTDRAERLGRLLLFLSSLARGLDPADMGPEAVPAPIHAVVARGIRLIEADLARNWTLDDLAATLRVSPGHLVRLFRRDAGLPPLAFLAHRRIEIAAQRLLETNRPVGEVGAEAGYPDANYFARRFRALTGLSPTAYRARLGRGDAGAWTPAAR